MTLAPKPSLRDILAKIVPPLMISAAIFVFFYYGGDAYQGFGLVAVDTTRKVLKYVLGVAAFLSLAVLAQRVIRYVIFEGLVSSATGAPVPKLLSQISGLLIYVIAISACAGIVFDQDLTVLWAASGVAGLVLGMALRELLQDVFAGIALNIDRAVRIGEYILLHKAGDSPISGQLLEISWRTTRIKDFNGDVVILPNSRFSSSAITNYSQPEPSSYRFATITLDPRVPADRAMRILQAAALEALVGLVGPKAASPWVEIRSIKPEGVEYGLYYKAEFRFLADAKPRVLQAVLAHLAQAGLEPARPLQELVEGSSRQALHVPDSARLVELIGRSAIFQGLSARDLGLLADHARLRLEPANRVVTQAGEANTQLYLVLEGLLTAESSRRTTSRPLPPPLLRPGDLFDPCVALLGEAHSCTVRTRTPVLLCELDHPALQPLFATSAAAFRRVGLNLAAQYAALSSSARPGGGANGLLTDDSEGLADDIRRQMRHLFPDAASEPADGPPRAAHLRPVG